MLHQSQWVEVGLGGWTRLQRESWAAVGEAGRSRESVTVLATPLSLSSLFDLLNQEAEGTGHTWSFPTSSERGLLSGCTGWGPPDVRPMLQVCCGILPTKVLSDSIKTPPAGFSFPSERRGRKYSDALP